MTQAFNLAQLANNLNTSGQLDGTDGLSGLVANANLASSGTANSSTFLRGDRTWSGLPALGKVLQVLQTIKTDTFTTTSGTFVDVTGLSVNITPSSTSSKILLLGSLVGMPQVSGCFLNIAFARNTTTLGLGDVSGSQARTMAATAYPPDSGGMFTAGLFFLDSPATTSSITYKIQVNTSAHTSATVFINRSQQDDAITRARGSSTITVMEIAA